MESRELDALVASVPRQLFIDGRWSDAASGSHLTTLNPATGRPLAALSTTDAGRA